MGVAFYAAGIALDTRELVFLGPATMVLAVVQAALAGFSIGSGGLAATFRSRDRAAEYEAFADRQLQSLHRAVALFGGADEVSAQDDVADAIAQVATQWHGDPARSRVHLLCELARKTLARARRDGDEAAPAGRRRVVLFLCDDQRLPWDDVATILGCTVEEARREAATYGVTV